MPEGLKIQVGADVQQAVKALGTDIPKAADKTAAAFSSMTQAVSSASQVLSKTVATSANNANSAITALANTIKTKGAAGFTVLGEAGQFAGSKLRSLSGVMNSTASQVPIFTNSITNSTSSLQGMGKSASLLRGILPTLGFGSLIAIASNLAGRLIETAASFLAVKSNAESSKISLEELNKTLDSQKGKIDALSDSIDFLNQINKIGIQINFPKGGEVLGLKGQISTQADLLFEVKGQIKNLQVLGDNAFKQYQENIINEKTYNTEIEKITKQRSELWGKEIKIQEGLSLLRANIRLQEFRDRQEEADRQDALNKEALANNQKYVSETISEAKRIQDAFKNGIDLKLGIGFFDSVQQQFQKSLSFLSNFRGGNFKFTISPQIEINPPPEDAKEGATEFGTMFYKELNDYFKNTEVTDFTLLKALQPVIKTDAQKLAETVETTISDAFKNISIEAFSSLGQAIGTALGGGDVKGVFENFANIVADGISSIGKQMIVLSPVIAALKTALKTLNPALLLPAGVALVAIGAALRASLSGGVRGFASGGLVTGPQLALIGEGPGTSRSNPEVVAPLDKLKGMLAGLSGGGVQSVIVTGRLRGNDMLLQNARTSRSQRRTTGR